MTRLKRKKTLDSPEQNDVRFGTPIEVAEHRAARLKGYDTIIEVGAGAGFQTNAFAKVAAVIAVEIDAERLGRAKLAHNVTPIAGDAMDDAIFAKVRSLAKGKVAIFLDPERPPAAAERKLDDIMPHIPSFLEKYRQISADIAIELPPFLADVPEGCEREYLSIEGKLNRLTVYFGKLKQADISVTQLPGGMHIAHNGEIPPAENADVERKYILEPDAALAHAGLAHLAISGPYEQFAIGKKKLFFAASPHPFFRSYKIIGTGKDAELMRCGTLILHGAMSPEEQRTLLRKLNPRCKGKQRMHLFVGKTWHLTTLA